MIFANFLGIEISNAVPFCSQDSSRNRQDSLKILAGAAKILSNSLHICEGRRSPLHSWRSQMCQDSEQFFAHLRAPGV